jgi:hypothetical protein
VSDSEGGGDSRFMTGFLVGFVVGVLICLGVGGSFLFVGSSHRRANQARMDAIRAEEAALRERDAARRLLEVREAAARAAQKQAAQNEKDKGSR